jgi:hypothetical protein
VSRAIAPSVRFASRVFRGAAIYGVLVLVPQYFLEERIGRDTPPPITHPEYFYGFIGVALAWQLVFFLISRDPVRYRPLMLLALVEKASFGVAAIALFLSSRLSAQMLGAGLIDLVLGALFVIAYVRTAGASRAL